MALSKAVLLIRICGIRFDFARLEPDSDPGWQKWPTYLTLKRKKWRNVRYCFEVPNVSLLRTGGFSCLFGSLVINKIAFLELCKEDSISTVKFYNLQRNKWMNSRNKNRFFIPALMYWRNNAPAKVGNADWICRLYFMDFFLSIRHASSMQDGSMLQKTVGHKRVKK